MEKETKKVSKKTTEEKAKTEKVTKKETKVEKTSKKEVKSKGKTTKKQPKAKKESFFTGVRKEMKKVRWPLKKEMIKYSIATLSFIIFFALFFTLGDLIIAGLKMLVA